MTPAEIKRYKDQYRPEVARFLAERATQSQLVTYGELVKYFGGIPNGWGDKLTGIVLRIRDTIPNAPALSVIVVRKDSDLPSPAAKLYDLLRLHSDDEKRAEQRRCFDFDWKATQLFESRQSGERHV